MARQALFLGAVLIGTYLAVAYATGAGRLLQVGFSGSSELVRTFQGR